MVHMKRARQVVYATDFSTTSRRALDTAIALATTAGAALTIVHVLPPIVVLPRHSLDAATMARLEREGREWGLRRLARVAADVKRAGVKADVQLREGDASDQIVRAARSTRADFIVMGTHGRRGFPRLLLGSVASRVIATARCPVVTVRGR
jgi:nucleotide-binding universal stress UspA family protein